MKVSRLKSGKLSFPKKHSLDDVKKYIKDNISKIEKEDVPQQYRRLYGAIKGGVNRAKTAIRFDNGEYVNINLEEINAIEVAMERGFATVRDLLRDDKEFSKRLREAQNEGISASYNSNTILNRVADYAGKIFINGKETDRLDALALIDFSDKKMKRDYKSFLIQYDVHYKKSGRQLFVTIPTLDEIKESNKEPLELFNNNNDLLSAIEIMESPPKKGRPKKVEKKIKYDKYGKGSKRIKKHAKD